MAISLRIRPVRDIGRFPGPAPLDRCARPADARFVEFALGASLGEQSRFEVGLSTNFFVVQAQRDLATAQNSELRALLNYRKAIVDYGRVQLSKSQLQAAADERSRHRTFVDGYA